MSFSNAFSISVTANCRQSRPYSADQDLQFAARTTVDRFVFAVMRRDPVEILREFKQRWTPWGTVCGGSTWRKSGKTKLSVIVACLASIPMIHFAEPVIARGYSEFATGPLR